MRASERAMRKMFKFKHRPRTQRPAIVCLVAVLSLASNSSQSQGLVTSSDQNATERRPANSPPPPPSISTSFVIDGVHHLVQQEARTRPMATSESQANQAEGRAEQQQQQQSRRQLAGKILDYLTSAGSPDHHHHLLAPRRSANSSASLLRLVVAPFKPALRITQGMRSRSATSSYENRSRDGATECAEQRRAGRYGGILREAKNLLTSGFQSIEQRAGSILNLGSGLVATLIPLASLVSGTKSGNRISATEASINSSTTTGSNWFPPKLAQFAPSANLLQSKLEYVLGLLERSSERLPSFPSLHPEECIKRSVCEAYYEPAKYGAIGLVLRTLIPASDKDNMEFTVINKYRRAGDVGLKSRRDANTTLVGALWDSSEPSANPCRKQYEDCIVNLLDVAKNMVDLFVA